MRAIRSDFTKERAVLETRIAGIEASIAEQRALWNDSFNAKFLVSAEMAAAPVPGLTNAQQAELKKATEEATKASGTGLAAVEKEIATLTPQYTTLQSDLSHWQSEFEREVNGQRSGIIGLGPRARSIQDDHLVWRRTEAIRVGALLEHLTAEKAAIESQIRKATEGTNAEFQSRLEAVSEQQKTENARVASLREQVQQDQAGQFVGQQNQIRETLRSQIDARLGEMKAVQANLELRHTEEADRLTALNAEPRRDILTQTLALHRLFQEGNKGGQFAVTTYIILTLLFILVDTIPVLLKFFCKAGPYDMLLDRDEVRYHADHRAFLTSHERYMTQLAAGNLVAVTRNKPLEDALLDGVEHTRAAREFLNSLIEMEKAFHERLLLEQKAVQESSPEKLAVMEMMKKRFYDDLNVRMERFFAARHAIAS